MKLSPRLKAIAQFVPKGAIVGDVGTDHGYVPVYLVLNNIIQKAIAMDINKGPLENANSTIKEHGLEKNIQTRLGNGLESVKPGEIDTVIIAGMGGELIKEILEKNQDVVNRINTFILQPMSDQDILRKWMEKNGLRIIKEKLVKESEKIYEIIVATHGKMELENDIYYEVGKKLIENKDPILEEFIDKKIKKYNRILNMVKDGDSQKAINKRKECIEKIKKLEELKTCL